MLTALTLSLAPALIGLLPTGEVHLPEDYRVHETLGCATAQADGSIDCPQHFVYLCTANWIRTHEPYNVTMKFWRYCDDQKLATVHPDGGWTIHFEGVSIYVPDPDDPRAWLEAFQLEQEILAQHPEAIVRVGAR